jgi:nicotinate phosphoribosyltransferase
MSFEQEEEAFRGYYGCFGEHTIILVDTYDTLEGVKKAIEVAPGMRGVRLDSGDLSKLSKESRRLLDEAGLEDAMVFASGDLDEFTIADLVRDGASIDGFGVGTKLVTSKDAPSLGGVYKLVAVAKDGEWDPRIKLSKEKATYPGPKQVYRYSDGPDGEFTRDVIATAEEAAHDGAEPLLETVMEDGEPVGEPPELSDIRDRARRELERLPEQYRRITDFAEYPVEISRALDEKFQRVERELEERVMS